MRPADVHLSVEGRTLFIYGERWPVDTPENEDTEERKLPYEDRFGQFHRTVHLPFEVNQQALSESVSAECLEIVFERKRTPVK